MVAILSKELWLVQRITPLSIWIECRLSWKRQSLRKLNQNCVINKSDTKCRKKSNHFLSSERLCKPKNTWTLPWILQELKKPLGKLAVAVDIETLEAIRFELCMSGALMTVEICVLCGWWFWSAFEMVSETLSSCDTDGRELQWAILCSGRCYALKWTWCDGLEHSRQRAWLWQTPERNGWCIFERASLQQI